MESGWGGGARVGIHGGVSWGCREDDVGLAEDYKEEEGEGEPEPETAD